MVELKKPSKIELKNAVNKTVPDIIAPNLSVLFCGINPGLYTAAVGHHFGRPGNRFWKVLYESGFTPRLFHPSEQHQLLSLNLGITNFISRTTARADELSSDELHSGAKILSEKIITFRPRIVAILGVEAYRKGFNMRKANVGKQDHKIGDTQVWVLPNPSGLNAYYQAETLIKLFKELKLVAISYKL
jgi:TDG/mug DNA glycosylase family protein